MNIPGQHAKILADNDQHATDAHAAASNLVMNGKMVLQWGQEEVLMWLEQNGFADMRDNFARHNIDGTVLAKLTDSLLKEMGISSVGRRLHLVNQVQKVQVVARNQWRQTAIWSSEEYRPGPCNNILPFGFPCCFEMCTGKPAIYTATNAKLNVSQYIKLCNVPGFGFCGYRATR